MCEDRKQTQGIFNQLLITYCPYLPLLPLLTCTRPSQNPVSGVGVTGGIERWWNAVDINDGGVTRVFHYSIGECVAV